MNIDLSAPELIKLLELERAKNADLKELLDESLAVWTVAEFAELNAKYNIVKARYLLPELIKTVAGVSRAWISLPLMERNLEHGSNKIPTFVIGNFKSREFYEKVVVIALMELDREVIPLSYTESEWATMIADNDSFAVKAEAGDKINLLN